MEYNIIILLCLRASSGDGDTRFVFVLFFFLQNDHGLTNFIDYKDVSITSKYNSFPPTGD